LAGDPGAAILLMAMGFDVLSMNATNLPKVKSVIRSVTFEQAKQLLADVMQMTYAEQIHARVNRELREAGITRLIRSSGSDEN
jgi:phosphotransferase system, enzyme I, PtsP